METGHQAGFVNIFGLPNAGKSTLLNKMLGERLALTSPKVQTTRHRILGFLTEPAYQIIFSDTPGIISPEYKLHARMMQQVQSAVEDADIALLIVDITDDPEQVATVFNSLRLKKKCLLVLNKTDLIKSKKEKERKKQLFEKEIPAEKTVAVSAQTGANMEQLLSEILKLLPENPPFFPEEDLSDRPTRFFVSELIREQVYHLYEQEIPYHTAVLIQSFEELPHITKIRADIIVTRETQKVILIGKKGSMIKKLGTQARMKIEEFLGGKVYLELFVKVRPKWREKDLYLREYGY